MQHAVSKADWVALFREIGLTDDQMSQWHKLFENRHPNGHEAFLAWLGLPVDEIADIRNRYRLLSTGGGRGCAVTAVDAFRRTAGLMVALLAANQPFFPTPQ